MKISARGTHSDTEIEESGSHTIIKIKPSIFRTLETVSVYVTAPDADVAVSVNGEWLTPPAET